MYKKNISFALAVLFAIVIPIYHCAAQDDAKDKAIDLSVFSDAAHHWYDIKEKGTVIVPRLGHPAIQTNRDHIHCR
ncbi:MAG TPA: hypothetical protein VKH37_02025 [Ferruginibacter sp.]|nr:hypothetical protein [Ferruginibacter sp.]